MIVVFSLMRRRDGVSLDEFRRHWLDPHGPLVCRFPRLRRYSQNHVTALGGALPLDGFAELAYDTDADQKAATGSPEMAACDRDSPLFIGSVLRVVTTDRVIVPLQAEVTGAAKQITIFAGQAAAVEPALTEYRAAGSQAAGLIGLVENIPLRQRGPRSELPVLDVSVVAIVELWFAGEDARVRAMVSSKQTPFIHLSGHGAPLLMIDSIPLHPLETKRSKGIPPRQWSTDVLFRATTRRVMALRGWMHRENRVECSLSRCDLPCCTNRQAEDFAKRTQICVPRLGPTHLPEVHTGRGDADTRRDLRHGQPTTDPGVTQVTRKAWLAGQFDLLSPLDTNNQANTGT